MNDQIPTTNDPLIDQPAELGSDTTEPQSSFGIWPAAIHPAKLDRPFNLASMRPLSWILLAIAGILALAVLFPALFWGDQPLLIHNPYVQR